MNKIIFLVVLILSISTGHAIDLEDNVKDFQRVKDWTSFSLVDSYFGRVLATRAGTEDKRTEANLALTFPTNNKCILAPIDIIIKVRAPIEEEYSGNIYGNTQIDNKPVKRVQAKIQNDANSEFVFITILDKSYENEISNGKSMMVNFKGYGVIDFSLEGAKSAITTARNTCKKFSF